MTHSINSSGDGNIGKPTPISPEDLKLAQKAIRDKKAAEELLARLIPRIRQAVRQAVGGDQEADDIVSICLVEILASLGRYRGAGPIEAWAGRLSYRVMMRHLSRRRRTERTEKLTPVDLEQDQQAVDPEQEARKGRLRRQLNQHLEKLPTERRMTLVLRLTYQYSVSEVSKIMDVPVNTVRDRIRVGLKEMRRSISRDPELSEFIGELFNG